MQLNKERIKLWVDALRNGKWVQANGRLRRSENRRCCLGVACEVYIENNVVPEDVLTLWNTPDPGASDGSNRFGEGWEFYGEHNFLPDIVQEWLGVNSLDPNVEDDGVQLDFPPQHSDLSYLNDHGATLEQIADMIEKKYLGEAQP